MQASAGDWKQAQQLTGEAARQAEIAQHRKTTAVNYNQTAEEARVAAQDARDQQNVVEVRCFLWAPSPPPTASCAIPIFTGANKTVSSDSLLGSRLIPSNGVTFSEMPNDVSLPSFASYGAWPLFSAESACGSVTNVNKGV